MVTSASRNSDRARSSTRSRSTRVTVDLDREDYEALRLFAFDARMTHADVLRALVRELGVSGVASRVRNSVVQ